MKKIIFFLSPFSSRLSFSFSGRRPNLFSLPADLFPSSSAWLTLQKLFNLWQNKFVTDHWKIIIKHNVSMMISDIMDWASQIKSIGGLTKTRHRLKQSVMFLNVMDWFWDRATQPRPNVCDENKRHKLPHDSSDISYYLQPLLFKCETDQWKEIEEHIY